jgi:hypothetical protein
MNSLKDFTRNSLTTACLVGAVAIGSVQAATNPANPGATSTGDLDVSVTVPDLVWIQNLGDIALGYTPGSDAVGTDSFCVYSTVAAGYDITISSLTATATTTFTATGVAVPANTVSYGVKFDTDTDASDGADVTEALTIAANTPAAGGFPPTCATDNASIEVTFPETTNLDAAPADTYGDTLTLLIEPA